MLALSVLARFMFFNLSCQDIVLLAVYSNAICRALSMISFNLKKYRRSEMAVLVATNFRRKVGLL